jgi:hypothetical protein
VPPGRLQGIRLNSGAKFAEEVGATNVHRKLPIRLVNLFIDEGNPKVVMIYRRNRGSVLPKCIPIPVTKAPVSLRARYHLYL